MSRARVCYCGQITKNANACDACDKKRRERQPTTSRSERDPRSASARGYDRQWRKMRVHVLADQPICELCEELGYVSPAMEVHHIHPISQRPDLRLERSNLMALCIPCHRNEDERRRQSEKMSKQLREPHQLSQVEPERITNERKA